LTPHPQEDYFIISKKYPIFVVGDGVSLNFDEGVKYPKKSGAGEATKIFCEAVVAEAEKKYDNFKEADIKGVFEAGNTAVSEYNLAQGRRKETINYFDYDFFSATAAFLLIKDEKAYWWSLCDSGVVALKDGKVCFQSPNGWINFPKDWNEGKYEKEKIISRHRDYRNATENGKLIGYGAITGEKSAINYLNSGVIEDCDIFLVYTDGFENYIELEDFKKIFVSWTKSLKKDIEKLIEVKSEENPSKYGREKTLIAVSTKG